MSKQPHLKRKMFDESCADDGSNFDPENFALDVDYLFLSELVKFEHSAQSSYTDTGT